MPEDVFDFCRIFFLDLNFCRISPHQNLLSKSPKKKILLDSYEIHIVWLLQRCFGGKKLSLHRGTWLRRDTGYVPLLLVVHGWRLGSYTEIKRPILFFANTDVSISKNASKYIRISKE
jgi:hypothetical protein